MRTAAVALVCLLLAPASSGEARGTCAQDDALAGAAADLLLDTGEGQVATGAVLRAVRRAGSDLPAVHALRVRTPGSAARVRAWLERLESRSDAPLVCGEAQGPGTRLVLAGVGGGRLRPVPESPGAWRAELEAGFRDPRVVLRDGRGELAFLPRADGVVRVPDEMPRPVRVQLVADGPVGPRPVAERWLGEVAEDAPAALPNPGPSSASEEPVRGSHLGRRVAELRRGHGVLDLRPNGLLGSEARRHAERVCGGAPVGHELEPGADPEARLAARGIEARVVGEVVARGPRADLALEGLAESPSHRMTLVDRRFTDGGWGSARDGDGRVCVVVLLAAWPRPVPHVPLAAGPGRGSP